MYNAKRFNSILQLENMTVEQLIGKIRSNKLHVGVRGEIWNRFFS